jgi:hypothetical protein
MGIQFKRSNGQLQRFKQECNIMSLTINYVCFSVNTEATNTGTISAIQHVQYRQDCTVLEC